MEYERNVLKPTMAIGFLDGEDLTILSVGDNTLVFESADCVRGEFSLLLALYDIRSRKYLEFTLDNCRITDQEEKKFSNIYKIEFEIISPEDKEKFTQTLGDMNSISTMDLSAIRTHDHTDMEDKLNNLEMFAEGYSFYPYHKDGEFSESFEQQVKEWMDFPRKSEYDERFTRAAANSELTFSISDFSMYKQFLEMEPKEFFSLHLEKMGLLEHGIFSKPFTRIYIGSEFCHNLAPKGNMLENLLEKAEKYNLNITVAFSYVVERYVQNIKDSLVLLKEFSIKHGKPVEILVNDWGMLDLIPKDSELLVPVFGRLLNKRKKDPRVEWWWGFADYKKLLAENNLNCEGFINFLNKNNIFRFEFEAHLYKNKIPAGKHSLHFPFYQINTSAFCNLYAACTFSQPTLATNCPIYCSEYYFKFAKHLKMIGRGSTNFGFSDALLKTPDALEEYTSSNIDRLVFTPV